MLVKWNGPGATRRRAPSRRANSFCNSRLTPPIRRTRIGSHRPGSSVRDGDVDFVEPEMHCLERLEDGRVEMARAVVEQGVHGFQVFHPGVDPVRLAEG